MAPGPARLQLGSLKLATGYLDAHLIPQMGHPLPPEHPCSQCYSCGTKIYWRQSARVPYVPPKSACQCPLAVNTNPAHLINTQCICSLIYTLVCSCSSYSLLYMFVYTRAPGYIIQTINKGVQYTNVSLTSK